MVKKAKRNDFKWNTYNVSNKKIEQIKRHKPVQKTLKMVKSLKKSYWVENH